MTVVMSVWGASSVFFVQFCLEWKCIHFQNFGLEYERYLKEVVGVLESDETFRKKLEESNISDIKVVQLIDRISLAWD